MHAWSVMTGTRLSASESLAIRSLSAAYVNQYHRSEDPACQSPHIETLPDKEVVTDKLKSMFAMLRGGNG